MSEISVDRAGMEQTFARVLPLVDDLDTALAAIPGAPNGGIATELIGLVMAAASDSAGVAADSYRALVAIARDVMGDLTDNDANAAKEFMELKRQVEEVS
jgi:hypothetical protein